MRFDRFSGPALALALLALAGCGDTPGKPRVVSVTGRVFLNGAPLEFGRVMFQPIQGGQPATGAIESDGSFTLSTYGEGDGAAIGRHQVRVVCYSTQAPGAEQSGDASGDSLGDLLIPQRYASFATSEIEVSVLQGGNAPFILKLEGETPEPPEAAGGVDPPEAAAESGEVVEPTADPAAGGPDPTPNEP